MKEKLLIVILLIPSVLYCQDFRPYTIGPWKLGMSKEDVISFSDNGPYLDVKSTGGVETFNARINNEIKNVSFVFDDNKLDYIQVFEYEGKDKNKAISKFDSIAKDWEKRYEGLIIGTFKIGGRNILTAQEAVYVYHKVLLQYIDKLDSIVDGGKAYYIIFDVDPAKQPSNSSIRMQFGYFSKLQSYFVYTFQDRKGFSRKYANPNIVLE